MNENNEEGHKPEDVIMTFLPDPEAIAMMAGEFFPELQNAAVAPLSSLPTDSGLSEGGDLSEEALLEIPKTLHTEFDGRFPPKGPSSPLPQGGTPEEKKTVSSLNLHGFAIGANPFVMPNKDADLHHSGVVPELAPSLDPYVSGLLDVAVIRRDFPILSRRVNGRRLVWLDNAATTQKPQVVIDRLKSYYENENSNVHRGAHSLATLSTDAYEAAREKAGRFLNASSSDEIIFVRGATEGINLVAQTYGRRFQKDDEIVLTWLEHHANIVPWQMLSAERGVRLRIVPVDDSGQVLLDEYRKLLNARTRLVALSHVSNALGTITPVAEMTALAHQFGARVLVDGAQAVSHLPVDVQSYDCDFYVFSGHKVFGPTGIGVLYGKKEVLATMSPWQGGGNMIADVTFEKTIYKVPPMRFEAGTGNIADAVGLATAIDYVNRIGMNDIARYEHHLLEYATETLRQIPGLRIIGTAKEKTGVLSFVMNGFSPEDIGAALNREGIAVRAGHHCAQPTLRRFGLESTVRPSLAFYNTAEEMNILAAAIGDISRGKPAGGYR